MVRNVFVQRKVLELYQRMDTISYPNKVLFYLLSTYRVFLIAAASCRIKRRQRLQAALFKMLLSYAKAILVLPIMIQS